MVFIALQWQEMKTGGADTHDLAVAAKAQADASKIQADNTVKLAQAAVEQAAATKALADDAKQQADAAVTSANTARRSLQISSQQFRADQRPLLWGTPRGAFSNNDTSKGAPQWNLFAMQSDGSALFGVAVEIKNTGKTPAVRVVQTVSEYKIGPREQVEKEVASYVPIFSKISNTI